jgi:D-glycero-D-manno-heptose 1,7-bisphosphate phosphatase
VWSRFPVVGDRCSVFSRAVSVLAYADCMSILQPALFLDRDGVINENRANYVRSWADVALYPQALQALALVRNLPYKIIVVTNQSAVGRGIISLAEAEAINAGILTAVTQQGGRIDAIYLCPHAPADNCNCRKPRPGLLLQAAREHGIDIGRSIMIGDALTDLEAGLAAGVAQTILLQTGRGQTQRNLPRATSLPPFAVCDTLYQAVQMLLP